MKFALFIVLSLSAMAFAGPALMKNNQINEQQQQQQQQQPIYNDASDAKSPAIDILKQWCFSSQMSQQELTASFKKLVNVIKSAPVDETTEQAVMSERICHGALVQKSQQTGQTVGQTGADAKAHELIKDVYMDALISCKSRDCTQQLLKVISSQQVDTIRASYYMTRIAVSDKQSLKDVQEVKQFAESFIEEQDQVDEQDQEQQVSEAVERQKMFATTSLIGKWIQDKPADQDIKQVAQKVVKSIVERYIKPVSQQDVDQYKQASISEQQEVSQELVKKIAKRNAALKALANIPGHVLKQCQEAEQILVQLCKNKQELVTVRQSAIECLEQNDKQMNLLKQLTFDQQQPIEVRIAAYRALMTVAYQGDEQKNESAKEQMSQQIVGQVVKHCEESRNQQEDKQFVLYAISHLDNIRTSQQPEHQAIKETIAKNKQHYMQIQVLCKKFKQELSNVRQSSRNYKLEQEFNQLESGLVLEGDIIYESEQKQQQQQQYKQQQSILPKLVRVNMSMPIMGETVNVIEVTLRQNQMDEEILSVLKLAQNTKFNSESVSKVVDSFKSSVEKQQQQQQQRYNTNEQEGPVEADLTIKVDGCTVVYLCVDDIKSQQQQHHDQHNKRNTRSVYQSGSIVDEMIEFLKRQPVNFNRGFNVNINERLAKVLDVDANILAGLRFESRAQGSAKQGEFEIVAKMEPRFSFEAVVGPAKVSSKKLLQRVSTKSALGMRLRFKKDELVDIQLDLPMNTMELFTFETQLVEKTTRSSPFSYNYLPESIYGDEDIYSSYPIYSSAEYTQKLAKRSIYSTKKSSSKIGNWLSGRKSASGQYSHSYETSDKLARAVGLRGQLRVVASPSDMGLLVSALVQKYEPSMEGYRVKIEKLARQGDLKQYLVSVSTPNSRIERNMQVRLAKQTNSQRTLVKADIQSPVMSFGASIECVHSDRQYSIKTELVSRNESARKQWRHTAELGYISGTQSSSGRLAQFSYKPFVSIESTELKRPIQMSGQFAYQQSPKSVISYELKCSTYNDFVQGKIIIDQRDVKPMRTRQQRRSMQSPLELLLTKDLTFTHEMLGQVQENAIKVHQMVDWNCEKFAIQGDTSVLFKDSRKQQESRFSATCKLDLDQQVFTIERKCPTDQTKEYTVRVLSQVRPTGHQMDIECRHAGRRQQSIVAYKHKIDVQQVSQNKCDISLDLELIDTDRRVNEKFTGRARVQNERTQKTVQCELVNGNKLAKVNVDYQSLGQHQIQLELQGNSFQHKTELRNNKRQFAVQSRTGDKQTGQTCLKMMVELNKPESECKMIVEVPAKRTSLAADLKFASGKRSSIAIQSGRFASTSEFSFDTISRKNSFLANKSQSIFDLIKPSANLRFRTNLKDLVNKQAYWMDSALIGDDKQSQSASSFLRFDSPYYRTDLEFSPRDQETKFAAYERSKRSVDNYDSIYSTKDSSLYENTFDSSLAAASKLNLGANKLWMLRSIVSSPFAREQLKQQARRALFEYADRRQSHKHSFQYLPTEQRLTMDLFRQPNTEFVSSTEFEPIRAKAELSTNWSRPSMMSLESQLMNLDAEIKPFDQYESYAKVSALSRHPRSAFKKHDSEYRYKKDQGHKAWMKHVDADDKHHSLSMESDVEPKKYAKVAYESDKHGKASWEHKWRQQKSQRVHDNEHVYENKFAMRSEGPAENRWKHETSFQFEEPIRMVGGERRLRERRSYKPEQANDNDNEGLFETIEKYANDKYGYSPIEYLKHTNARLVSQTSRPNAGEQALYKLDFDYKPHQNLARFELDMPENMLHSSQIELKPTERLYKLQSKLYNRMTNEPSYEFVASSKPYNLATAEQEPVFIDTEHPMLERPISKSLVYNLFKQPMKLDYSDKWGRKANIDYDQSPLTLKSVAGLRQKRAAVYYKDAEADFEHSSSVDFYPETFMGKMKPSFYARQQQQQQQQRQQQEQARDVAFKTETKYGPIVVRVDSDEDTCVFDIVSPIVNAKLVGETGANLRKLYKLVLDNKSQRVQVSKMLRNMPETIRECQLVKKFARKLDSGRFEHQCELLVGLVDSIFKIKSSTKYNERPIVVIEGEWDQKQDKAWAKINGERINGQCMIDLVRKTADMIVDVDDKHTMHHVTRIQKTSDKFFSLESETSFKSRPVLKLSGKVSAQIFEPSHLFARRHFGEHQRHHRQQQQQQQEDAHVSTFEATLYEPSLVHVTGQYDCDAKEARLMFKNVDEKRFSETLIRFDETTDCLNVESRLTSAKEGTIYATKARLSLPGLSQRDECVDFAGRAAAVVANTTGDRRRAEYTKLSALGPNNCQSELIYSDKSGNWSAKFQPGEYVTVSTPNTKQTINLAGDNYYY